MTEKMALLPINYKEDVKGNAENTEKRAHLVDHSGGFP